jgi:16S rRNA (guanine527-N7)-methyltransferase
MPTLSESAIESLLTPYLHLQTSPDSRQTPSQPANLYPQLSLYLDLLLKWNARTNLTAIREPDMIVRRHFGESLFAGLHVGPCPTLLDLGSGAGFPGLPIAILRPEIAITLAESQNKKATFLREIVRSLGLSNVEVWASRAESMPPARQFDTVTLRAVDDMASALTAAAPRASRQLLLLTSTPPHLPGEFTLEPAIHLPETHSTILLRASRSL